jgi:predicted dehydrogenase
MAKDVGIGIIGTGFARKVQIPAFLACEGATIASVASGSVENARSTAREFGIGHFTDDWHETIRREDVQLVCVTTPPSLHREMAVETLRAGKHVLCEKPMAMNVAEAREMCDAAKDSDRLALIDHELRFQPGRQKAREMLLGGAIGRVRHAKYIFKAPHRGDPEIPWNWWSDAAQGGGALGAINSHVIDSLRWMLGTEIASVSCQLHTNIKGRRDSAGIVREVTSDDQANMILAFGPGEVVDDATGLVSVSMVEGPGYVNRMEFYGSDGALRIDHRGELWTAERGAGEWKGIDVPLGRPIDGAADTGFSRGFMAFAPLIVDAIKGGETQIEGAATFIDGLRVQEVLDAARESDRTGGTVTL